MANAPMDPTALCRAAAAVTGTVEDVLLAFVLVVKVAFPLPPEPDDLVSAADLLVLASVLDSVSLAEAVPLTVEVPLAVSLVV